MPSTRPDAQDGVDTKRQSCIGLAERPQDGGGIGAVPHTQYDLEHLIFDAK